ncbi:hypothetical protein H4R33_000421 [Dimargaris cristalligena]|uniref:Phosphatidylglycerol/phosphatidylinositol transfer protein n=1 Tax=Dimargaris cristalligena TaxID=215637 RepID=A0A4Q0A0X0_9FUNG|nr:hypothetical protein H4R33_000421 [Dimargaris cristalligena]RKP38770.1 hypothetical protein BJ085DRAFT_39884 [Dimargaris cristalligena]|eukprot:RKP38770.1 hypothetical protein BJ085DRAFT_39884 [Dimargaris cristalligena]
MKLIQFAVWAPVILQGLALALPTETRITSFTHRDSPNKCGPPQVPTPTTTKVDSTTTIDSMPTDTDGPTPGEPSGCNVFASGFAEYEIQIVGATLSDFTSKGSDYADKVARIITCFTLTAIIPYDMKLTFRIRSVDAEVLRTWPETSSVIEV